MILRYGHMNLKELAEWFGCSYSTMRKASGKQKRLKILEMYANFSISEKGGVDIKEIYCDTYIDEEMPIKDWIEEAIPKLEVGLSPLEFLGTSGAITELIKHRVQDWQLKHGKKELAESSISQYVKTALQQLYGDRIDIRDFNSLTYIEQEKCGTDKGVRLKEYLIKLDKLHYRLLTNSEMEIFLEIAKEVYENEPLQLKLDRDAFLAFVMEESDYDNKSGKQIKQEFKQFHNPFWTIWQKFKERTGFSVVSQGTIFHLKEQGIPVVITEKLAE